MKSDDINRIIGIKESFQLPGALMGILLENPVLYFEKFLELGEPLDHDWFTEYFEEEHSNKSKMAQDFTPSEVCDLLAGIVGNAGIVADVCAGTGGLAIGMWNHNRESQFVCYELSERAIPLLLFNLAIRNIDALVYRCNILTGETFEIYQVTPSFRFAKIEQLVEIPPVKVDAVVSNPPYSMKYDPKKDDRFPEYAGMLPSNFADYVFVAFALSVMKNSGTAVFILPHGVLFRANKEKAFRRMLVESDALTAVIGLPDRLFLNTGIPVCIIELQKDGALDGVFFIDASKDFEKLGKQNKLRQEDILKILAARSERKNIDHFAYLADKNELEANDFNLNIPRYVDTFAPEPLPDVVDTIKELGRLEKELIKTEKLLLKMTAKLYGTTPQADEEHKRALREYKKILTDCEKEYKQEVLKFDS